MSSRHKQKNKIRQLRIGDAIPLGVPARYPSKRGYVRLRWKVGVYEYVEVYEHRIVAGLVSRHVHHKNEDKSDNSPDNLKPVSTLEHGAEHSKIDMAEAARLYAQGWSLPQLGRRYSVGNASVMRSLKLRGVRMRTLAEAWHFRKFPVVTDATFPVKFEVNS